MIPSDGGAPPSTISKTPPRVQLPNSVHGQFDASSIFGATPTPNQAAAQAASNAQTSLQQYQDYLSTNMGRIDYKQIGKQVASELGSETSPLLAGLNAQQKAGQAAITGYTQTFANQLGQIAPQISGAYNQAEQSQSSLDTALAAELRGNGGDQAAALQATLAQAGQNTSPAAQAAASAQGAAGASYASGSASLAQLFSQGAAETAYGKSLPGIAALSGLQATKSLQSDISSQRAKIISDAQKQVPTLANQMINQQLKGQQNIATGLKNVANLDSTNAKNAETASLRQQTIDTSNRALDIAGYYKQQAATLDQRKLAVDANYKDNQIRVRQDANNLRSQQIQIGADLKSRQLSDSEAKQAQNYAVQLKRLGIESYKVTIDAAKTQLKMQNGGFTPLQVSHFKGTALTLGQLAHDGGTDKKGNPLPKLSYQNAILEGQKEGIPLSILLPAVNRFYAPGVMGRPLNQKTVTVKSPGPLGVTATGLK